MMQYKIEKGVPIPSSKNHKNSLKPLIDMAIKMKDGDSVVLEYKQSNSLVSAINKNCKNSKALRRKIPDSDPVKYRIWKIKGQVRPHSKWGA